MSESEVGSRPQELPQETLDWFKGDELRARVFFEKYALKSTDGSPLERTPPEMWRRIAREIAGVEAEGKRAEWEEKFYWLLEDFRFVPGGRVMFGAGNPRKVTLINCYYLPIREDSIEGIFAAAGEMARTYSYGGGVGIDVSILRPRGSPVHNSALTSTGSISFMELYSLVTGTIGQAGRRGALMITIRVEHPDVLDFIRIKDDPERRNVRYANISVKVTDQFMKAVQEDADWELWYPDLMYPDELERDFGVRSVERALEILRARQAEHPEASVLAEIDPVYQNPYDYPAEYQYWVTTGELRKRRVYRVVKAREIFDELVRRAWSSAEPGVIFWSTVKEESPSEYDPKLAVQGTNPCSEQPLEPYGACNLGNINLASVVRDPFTEKASVDWELLERIVRYAVRFLDDVLDYNRDKHPLREQSEHSMYGRRVGLGVTGLADMLAMLRIRYDSEDALRVVDEVFSRIKEWAYDESSNIAAEKGPFPAFNPDKHLKRPFVARLPEQLRAKIAAQGLRNVALLTVPPVGSGSILAGVSSGIEPIFAISYRRRSESLSKKEYKVYHPTVKIYMDMFGIQDEGNLPDYFVTAHDIEPEFRVRMQATIQKHVDSAISSTVNLPREISVEEVGRIYRMAWETGCKGITVYREGSREDVLVAEGEREAEAEAPRPGAPKPRARGFRLYGITYKFRTEAGNLYVTVNRNGDGRPFEAFVQIGKSGSTLGSLAEALGRLVSLALRSGVPPEEVARQLRGIKSVPTRQPPGGPVQAVDSIPDAVARALELEAADGGRGGAPVYEDRRGSAAGEDPGVGGLFLDMGHKVSKI
ncbi:MAG: adenosylcobalamin-dependent ribonucleoside-diphosphate reductase [Conexivisphaera sp.]